MQYQIYKEDTDEIVAWIDTEDNKGIVAEGYAIKGGEDLECVASNNNVPFVAQFEKVSEEVYYKACTENVEVMTHIQGVGVVGTDKYLSLLELPRRSTKGSAGYDFFLPYNLVIGAGETVTIPTGIKVKMAEGYVLMFYPRSSLGYKYKMTLDNTVGVVDCDYYGNESNEGHITVKMTNHSDNACFIPKGQAYCQAVFHRYYLTDDDSLTEKAERVGGYGSTNN